MKVKMQLITLKIKQVRQTKYLLMENDNIMIENIKLFCNIISIYFRIKLYFYCLRKLNVLICQK